MAYLSIGLVTSERNRQANQIATEIAWAEDWVARQPPKNRLIISNASTLNWMMKKTPCLNIPYARGRATKVAAQLSNGTFQEVLVFQYCRPTGPDGGFVLDSRDALPASYALEPLDERLFGSKMIRVSRVSEIKMSEASKDDRTLFVNGFLVATVGPTDGKPVKAETGQKTVPQQGPSSGSKSEAGP